VFLVVVRAAAADRLAHLVEQLRANAAEAPIAFTLGAALKPRGAALSDTLAMADRKLYEARAERADQPSFHAR
jgi:GGDEF domain-containing protein